MTSLIFFLAFLIITMPLTWADANQPSATKEKEIPCELSDIQLDLNWLKYKKINQNLTTVYLIGDSVIGDCFKSTYIAPGFNFPPKNSTAKFYKDQLPYFHTTKLYSSSISVNYIGHYLTSVHYPELMHKELYKGFNISQYDIMIIWNGHHFLKYPISHWTSYLKIFYEKVVSPFPGLVLWVEPLPTHFKQGVFTVYDNSENRINCYPWTQERNISQFHVVSYLREFIKDKQSDRLLFIPNIYDKASLMWNCHKPHMYNPYRPKDCQHYDYKAYKVFAKDILDQLL